MMLDKVLHPQLEQKSEAKNSVIVTPFGTFTCVLLPQLPHMTLAK
jgi:hypothetical protein